MSQPRLDRRIVQAPPTDDARRFQVRVNEALRQLSEQILKLEGRGGEITLNNQLTVKAEGYTLMDFESSVGGRASISAAKGTTRGLCLAKGARRDSDGQWVATDTGAVILELLEDGTMNMYADTSLVVGAAYTPTVAVTFPTSSTLSPHGITSTYHTASGLVAGQVLSATDTNAFAFASLAVTQLPVHPLVSTYHTISGITTNYVLTATATNSYGWAAAPASSLMDLQSFTTAATTHVWTKPTSFTPKSVQVVAIGAGGGGGSGGVSTGTTATTYRKAGCGGGGGAYVVRFFRAADLSTTEAVTVGAGGIGGTGAGPATGVGNAGAVGGYSAFGTAVHTTGALPPVYAGGGGGGARGANGNGTAAGGSGGGSAGEGQDGTTSPQPGGYPRASFIASVGCTGNGGSQGGNTANPYPAEYGGAGGGGTPGTGAGVLGGVSLYGGGGGGAGGGSSSTATWEPTDGGVSGVYNSAGGAANAGTSGTAGGAAPVAGNPGAAGNSEVSGCGGGGGGGSYHGRQESGAAGGVGGQPGGGGGGGGGCYSNGSTHSSGAGGNGGAGAVYVFTFG